MPGYVQKQWRETRGRFFMLLTLLACVEVSLVALPRLGTSPGGGWAFERVDDAVVVHSVWRRGLTEIGVAGMLMASLVGLVLGGSGVGEEFRAGTLAFLLTRPRSRDHFVWWGWATLAVELAAIVLVGVALSGLSLLYFVRSFPTWELLLIPPVQFVVGLNFLSLSYCMTTITRGAMSGLATAFGILVGYMTLRFVASDVLGPRLPWVWNVMPRLAGRPYYEVFPFDGRALCGWLVVALLFPLVSAIWFRRAEV